MGRQAYLTRVCLGRSAFEPLSERVTAENEAPTLQDSASNPEETSEPASNTLRQGNSGSYQQQYDRKGYPENPTSRALSRQSRRAINDILTTVGVCVGVDADGQVRPVHDDGSLAALDKSKVAGIIRENEIGVLIGMAEALLNDLASMWTIGLRFRLQTFSFYSGIPLTAIVRLEWMNLGFLNFLFAGVPGDIACILLNVGRLLKVRIESLDDQVGPASDHNVKERVKGFLWKTAGQLSNLTFLGLLASFRIHSTLQRQGLLPTWPLFPHLTACIPFSPSSPLRMSNLQDRLGGGSCLRVLASLAVNPVVLSCVHALIRTQVDDKIQRYTRAALPAPDFPDIYSIQAAIEDDVNRSNTPGLGNATRNPELWQSRSVTELLAKDLQSIGSNAQILYNKFWSLLASARKESSTPPVTEQTSLPTSDSPSSPSPSPSYDPSSSSASGSRASSPTPQIEITQEVTHSSSTSSPTFQMRVAIPVPESASPLLPRRPRRHHDPLPSPSSPAAAPDDGPSTTTITTTTTTINDNDKHDNGDITSPSYHITTLTAQAADSMAQHLSGFITDLLLLPLEALYVRSVALAFLSSPAYGTGAAERWKGEVYPLGGWFGMVGLRGGGGGWKGAVDYAGKMVLVGGVEMGVGVFVWQVSVGLTWWVGRRWFAWGRL